VAIDGTKIKANASRHRSVPYDHLCERELHWQKVVQELLEKAEKADQDAAEQATDELPTALAHAEARLEAIRFAKESLATKAQQNLHEAQKTAAPLNSKTGRPPKGQESNELHRLKVKKAKGTLRRRKQEAQQPSSSHNFVDPDSQLMRDGATGSITQAYNAQAAVDGERQIIVACNVTEEATDSSQLAPMIRQVFENLQERPKCGTADTGYWDSVTISELEAEGYVLLVPPERKLVEPLPPTAARNSIPAAMRERPRGEDGTRRYRQRSSTVEPVFGWIKQQRGFRQFALRGKSRVRAEWALIYCTHNLLKLVACRSRVHSPSTGLARRLVPKASSEASALRSAIFRRSPTPQRSLIAENAPPRSTFDFTPPAFPNIS
jgi:hypothetical protein